MVFLMVYAIKLAYFEHLTFKFAKTDPAEKCRGGNLSVRNYVVAEFCLCGKMSRRNFVCAEFCRGGILIRGKMSGGILGAKKFR